MIHWGLKTPNHRSVQETEQYLYHVLPLNCRTIQRSWARSQQPARDVIIILRSRRTHNLKQWVTYTRDRSLPTLRWIRGKNYINTVQFLAQTDGLVFLDLNVSSRAAGFNLVLSVYVFFVSQSRESHWLPLYDWQTATVWVKNLLLKKQSHLHLGVSR